MSEGAIPLFLLTGFLGSGKTTLLSKLVRDPAFADTAVIVNEFGEIGLDHALVSEGREDGAVLLDSGCLCCTLGDSLDETLEALYYKRERGDIPRFARVVVETTGLADPAPIANALAAGRLVSRRFRLASILTTVDGVHGGQQLDEFDEARGQVVMADRLIVTKSDVAPAADLQSLLARLGAMNPHADIRTAVRGNIPAETVLDAAFHTALRGTHACDHHSHAGDHDHEDGSAEHIASHGFLSHVVRCERAVTWEGYAAWLESLQAQLGDRLLRVKGLLRIGDGLYAVHGVRRLFDAPQPVSWSPPSELVGAVVMIARNADRKELASAALRLSEAQVVRQPAITNRH